MAEEMGKYQDATEFDVKQPPSDLGSWNGPPGEFFTGQYPPPRVPGGSETPGKGVTTVSTEALKLFAGNIRSLLPALREVRTRLLDVKLAPGAFYDAHQLMVKVVGAGDAGTGGLQPTTLKFVENAINAITVTADELDKLASAYATAEELNRMTGMDLGEHIERAKGYITTAVGAPVGVGSGGSGGGQSGNPKT
ncbi:hypothetical protein [Allokutzneria oryzae]|uniref:YbaB/EbfC family DNA-binding protein n=1 Tax=Allokutzneria oryzae TaxID=1378989 RepID=A0ABV6A773_9PSEU